MLHPASVQLNIFLTLKFNCMEKFKLSPREEYLGKRIVNAAYTVHKELGPGLLEKVYESCMYHLLREENIIVVRQSIVPVHFRGLVFDDGIRLDLCVEDMVLVELKAVEAIIPIHQAQILTQLKLTGKNLGYLINFNVPLIKDGIHRYIYNHKQ